LFDAGEVTEPWKDRQCIHELVHPHYIHTDSVPFSRLE
jgi:hypothetical protein